MHDMKTEMPAYSLYQFIGDIGGISEVFLGISFWILYQLILVPILQLQTYYLHVKNLSTRQENAEQGIDFPALTLGLLPSRQQSALDNLDIQPITLVSLIVVQSWISVHSGISIIESVRTVFLINVHSVIFIVCYLKAFLDKTW